MDMENLGSIEDDQAAPEQAASQPLVIVDHTGHEWEFPAGTDVEKAKAFVSSRVPPAKQSDSSQPMRRIASGRTGGSVTTTPSEYAAGVQRQESFASHYAQAAVDALNPMTYIRAAAHPIDTATAIIRSPLTMYEAAKEDPAGATGALMGGMLTAKAVPIVASPATRGAARVTGRALSTLGEHPWSMRAAGVAAGVGHSGGLGIAIAAAPEYLVKIGTALERWGTKPGALAGLPANKQLEIREMIRDAQEKLTPDTPNFPEIKQKLDSLDAELKAARANARLAPELKNVEKERTRLDTLDRKRARLEKSAGTPEVSDEEAIRQFWGGKKPTPPPPGTIRVATPARDAVDAMMETRPSAAQTVIEGLPQTKQALDDAILVDLRAGGSPRLGRMKALRSELSRIEKEEARATTKAEKAAANARKLEIIDAAKQELEAGSRSVSESISATDENGARQSLRQSFHEKAAEGDAAAGEGGLNAADAAELQRLEALNAERRARASEPAAPVTPAESPEAFAARVQGSIRSTPAETPAVAPAASAATESILGANELQSLSKATGIKADALAGFDEKRILDLLRYTQSKFPERIKANPDAAALLKRLEGKAAPAAPAAPGEKPIRTTAPEPEAPPLEGSRSKDLSPDFPGQSMNDLAALAEFVRQNPGVSAREIATEIRRQRVDRNTFYKKYGKAAERLDRMADEAMARDRR